MKKSELKQIIKEEISKILKENETVDRILDKITIQGKDSLTPEEKEYLERYSKGEKNIPEPITLRNKPTSTSSAKAQQYPYSETPKEIEVYDNIVQEFENKFNLNGGRLSQLINNKVLKYKNWIKI
jgi:DNA-binding CsgD family transcriptional regulator